MIVTLDGRALLFRFRFPGRTFWGTPGGALADGEDYVQAARRELWEETGISAEISGEFHRRETTYRGPQGNLIYADERFFSVRVEEPSLDNQAWETIEREVIQEVAWLTSSEIRRLNDPVFPENFADLVEAVHRGFR